jgi:hypothetical protein
VGPGLQGSALGLAGGPVASHVHVTQLGHGNSPHFTEEETNALRSQALVPGHTETVRQDSGLSVFGRAFQETLSCREQYAKMTGALWWDSKGPEPSPGGWGRCSGE